METPRISASSYSNTAPLIWPLLYGSRRGEAELILDNAPARSAELLAQDRVDAALTPVIVSQLIEGVRVIPDVCVGAVDSVRSVCLVTDGRDLADAHTVVLDRSSRTSVALTKIIFREFLGSEPEWRDSTPDVDAMLASSDAALLIGDPALSISHSLFKVYDLAELWNRHTGLGFIFAMWMTRRVRIPIDLAAVRDEGVANIGAIAQAYAGSTGLDASEMTDYLSRNIQYTTTDKMIAGMELYFDLAAKHDLIPTHRPIKFIG